MHRYHRTDALRILRITGRQLAAWQRAGLVSASDTYTFVDLLQLKKVRDLASKKVRPAVIRASLQAMQKQVAGMENPLLEAGTYSTGHRVIFRHEGMAVDALAGQYIMDFDPRDNVVPAKVRTIADAESAADYFARGVMLEDDATTQEEAIAAYQKVLEIEPQHAPAHINLGTLYYGQQKYAEAEQHYRLAVEAEPRYALAHFDLGNVLDETGRLGEAVQAYRNALRLAPTYADAHYNLALAYEKLNQARKALMHWRTYVKLDSAGPWAVHARNQVKRIMSAEKLRVVYRKK